MTEVANGIVSGIGGEAYKDAKKAVVSIDKTIDSAKNLGSNHVRLMEEAAKLYARRDDVMDKIKRDRTKRAGKELQLWSDKVNKLKEDVQKLDEKYDKEKRRTMKHVRIAQSSKLSKRMEEKRTELHNCWEEGSTYATEVVVEVSQRPVIRKHKAPKIENKKSLYDVFEKTVQFLRNKDLKRIGLWGKVGVGKTAIMQNLKENEQIAEMFDLVIFITLTDEWDEDKLQYEIANQLGLSLEGIGSTKTYASAIAEKLKSKRYLLLLDEVWGIYDLDNIGIHDNGKDSKVVLASRDLGYCRYMHVDDVIDVLPLKEDEALKLFEECLGRKINPSFKPIAQQIIRECGNLPLLIDRVAVNFRKKDSIPLWRAGFNGLRTWPNAKDQSMDEVLNLLRFCYEELGDENKRLCFLYGALYSEGCDICIDYLLECWRAEGFINDAEQSLRDKGQEILHDLINLSLLESGQQAKHVRMDKIFRKMALKISSESEDSKCLVMAGKELQEPPEEKKWEHTKRISLMDNKLCKLPNRPDCNSLSTLLLQRNSDLMIIPQLFFKSMQNLRVLDLHGTNIGKIPSSISCLKCLRALYVNSCKNLLALPSEVKALKKLEVLDIRRTKIYSLPVQIGGLGQLRCFRMSFSKIDTVPRCFHMPFSIRDTKLRKLKAYRNAISKLSLLEELIIDVDSEIQWWGDIVKAMVKGVATLKRLTHLSFSIYHDQSSRYKILDYFEYERCKCLKYANGVSSKDDSIIELLGGPDAFDAFELLGHKGVVVLSDFGLDNINKIRTCLIEGCNEMETIIDGNRITTPVLTRLEKMYISNVPKLESLWKGAVPTTSLCLLTTLVFFKCPILKKIFSGGLVEQLSKLQHLEVESCHEIEEIIVESENNLLNSQVLTCLETLMLVDLPKLVSIGIHDSFKWPSLERYTIAKCPSLQRLPSRFSATN